MEPKSRKRVITDLGDYINNTLNDINYIAAMDDDLYGNRKSTEESTY